MIDLPHSEYAFPFVVETEGTLCTGMTLRDYFAVKAMQAIISKVPLFKDGGPDDLLRSIADGAYSYADTMLEARK